MVRDCRGHMVERHSLGGVRQAGLGQGWGKKGTTSLLSVTRKPPSMKVVPGQATLAPPTHFSHLPTTTDVDECQAMACENGECVNTEGSFHCFCSPPLTLDLSQQHCVNSTSSTGRGAGGRRGEGGRSSGPELGGSRPAPAPPEDLPDHDIHMDICWKKVTNYVCSQPLHGHRTTYTECCCQDGEAWSQQCALCPPRSSGE